MKNRSVVIQLRPLAPFARIDAGLTVRSLDRPQSIRAWREIMFCPPAVERGQLRWDLSPSAEEQFAPLYAVQTHAEYRQKS
jgi:hypothetical protein